MCLKLENRRHCLSFLSILGFLQLLLSLPIVILSFIVFAETSLGAALSPFWCGFVLMIAGFAALFIRPTRLACMIFIHVILNAFCICTCFLAAGITGLYGTSVHLEEFNELFTNATLSGSDECIFSVNSPLYTESFRDAFRPLDSLVPSCEDLETYWTYLIGLLSLSFMGLLISIIAIISNCITPCVEDEYGAGLSDKTDV